MHIYNRYMCIYIKSMSPGSSYNCMLCGCHVHACLHFYSMGNAVYSQKLSRMSYLPGNNCEQFHKPHSFCYGRDSGLLASWHIAASPAAASPATVSFTLVSATDQRKIQAAIAQLNTSSGPDRKGNSPLDWAPVGMGADKGWPASHRVSSF